MVATDLASRGLDFVGVDHVIMFDFSLDALSFMHRVGRTGRMGREGKVTLLIREKDMFLYSKIKEVIDSKSNLENVFSRKRSLSKTE